MAVLLVVHHTPSPGRQELLDAVLAGAHADGIDDVDVRTRVACFDLGGTVAASLMT